MSATPRAQIGIALVLAAIIGSAWLVLSYGRRISTFSGSVTNDADDVMDGAVRRRFRMRQAAIADMTADLRAFVAAESAYHADHGTWQPNLPREYFKAEHLERTGSNFYDMRVNGPSDGPGLDGWRVSLANRYTDFVCSVFVGRIDTLFPGQRPGEPFCQQYVIPQASAPLPVPGSGRTLVAENQGAATPPADSGHHEPAPQSGDSRRPRIHGPDRPPLPMVLAISCPGEGCQLGAWAACRDVAVSPVPRAGAGTSFTLRKGDRFTAVTGEVHVQEAGVVVVHDPIAVELEGGTSAPEQLHLVPGDTLYLLLHTGEGFYEWWFQGERSSGAAFWTVRGEGPARLVRPEVNQWWVQVQRGSGDRGWLIPNGETVAGTSPHYDNGPERCASK